MRFPNEPSLPAAPSAAVWPVSGGTEGGEATAPHCGSPAPAGSTSGRWGSQTPSPYSSGCMGKPTQARGTRPQGQLHTSHFAPVLSSQGRVSRLRPRPAGSPRSSLTWAAKATVRSALPAPPWPCPSSLSVLPSAGPRRAPALCRPSSAGPSPARHWPSPSGKMAAQ